MRNVTWLGIIRHGESTGNVAASSAEASGTELIDIAERDADVPLSDVGRQQASAVARWFDGLPVDGRPEAAVVSPYLRAQQTADLALAGLDIPTVRDERLRDRDLGILDLHTVRGIRAEFPAEAARRKRLGKFYYRPPGGESWADVLLRLRSLLRDVDEDHSGQRVLLVGHDALVSLLRYVMEEMDEPTLMASVKEITIANCSITSWRQDGRTYEPELFNYVEHLRRDDDARPTTERSVDADV
ncbi:MAG: putative phosphoglycerate mutase [Nocardioidaceae bacterium]|nr:putative phosphoglycerate mutase [Nocardioidaceae bacterium]